MERNALAQTVADNIESVMKAKGLNPSSLAREAGMNPTGVYDILKAKSQNPRLDTLGKLADALKVPLASFFEEREEGDVRTELHEVYVQLPPEERRRLLLTARAWIAPPAASEPS